MIEKTEKDKDYQAISALYETLLMLETICGGDVSTHFSDRIGKAVKRALKLGKARL